MPTGTRRHIPHSVKLNRLPVIGISADDICVTIDATITSTTLPDQSICRRSFISIWNTGMKYMLAAEQYAVTVSTVK